MTSKLFATNVSPRVYNQKNPVYYPLMKGGNMAEEKDTFEIALNDVIANQIMDNFDNQLREKIAEIIKSKDPKALRNLVRNLCKSLG